MTEDLSMNENLLPNENHVLPALQQQVGCYQDLAKLAMAQHEFVQNSRTEDLLALLAKRQELLDVVGELEQTIAPAKKKWHQYLDTLNPQDRAACGDAPGEHAAASGGDHHRPTGRTRWCCSSGN